MAIGKYEVLGPLGRGRLGEVLLGEAVLAGPRVALLRLAPELARRPGLIGRLFAACEGLRALGHPGLLSPLDWGEAEGQVFVATEYVAGETLGERLAAGERDVEEDGGDEDGSPGPDGAADLALPLHPINSGDPVDPLEIGRQLAEALVAAQAHGLGHGDLQARCVLLAGPGPGGRVRLRGVGVTQVLTGEGPAALGPADVLALGQLLERLSAGGHRAMSTAPTLPPPGERGESGAPFAHDLPELLGRMLAEDPAARPGMERVAETLTRLQGPRGDDNLGLAVQPGQSLGSYRLVRRLGGGGMGVVFEAVHTRLSRQAAIKVLRPELSQDQEMVRRFFTEAESVNIVRHPGIVNIYEFGQLPDKTVYIVMEYLAGDSLEERLHKAGGRLGVGALRLMRQVASALQAAHERGVVHRDLKPENVMIIADPEVPGGERTKILDFGIAKMAAAADSRRRSRARHPTEVGQALGTPLYMAPEQCQDAGAVDDRADVYSFAVMLYEVLTGRPPFEARGFAAVAALHLHAKPPTLREIDPTLPVELEELLLRMLAKVPADRPPMGEVAGEIERLLQRIAPSASGQLPLPLTVPPPAPVRRARRLLTGLGLGALLAAGGYLGAHSARRPPPLLPPAPLAPETARAPAPALPAEELDLVQLRARAIAVLQEGLRDADPVLRRRALQVLGGGHDGRYAVLIEPLLRDLDATVAAQAASALSQLGARDSAPVLLRAAALGPASRSPRIAVAVGAALGELGAREGEALLRQAARGRDEDARRIATLYLLERADKRARRALGRLPLDDDLLMVLGRLGRAGDKDALGRLQKALQGSAGEQQLRVAEELAHAEAPAGRALLEKIAREGGPLQLRAARILASLDDPSAFALFTARFGDPARPLPERVLAAEGLGACGRRESAPLLASALPRAEGPLRLRMAAAGAILQIAASDPALLAEESLRLAETGLDEDLQAERLVAADSLGEAEPRVAVPLLGRAMKDRQPEVRKTAARALGRTRARAAVPVLGQALDDSARTVRTEAMNSIGQVGSHLRKRGERVDDIVGTVVGHVDQGDEGERLAGVTALLRLGDGSRREQLRSWLRARDPEMRREAIDAWSADPEGEAGPLLESLRDPVFGVRFAAAARLAERGSKEAVPVLQEALLRKGPEALTAHGLLSRLGIPSTAEAALRAGPVSARLATVAAAAHLPAGEALQLLRQGAKDAQVEVRHKVIEVAAELPALSQSPAGARLLESLRADADAGVRVHAGLLLSRLGLGESEAREGNPDLRRAQAEYLAGRYAEAVALARRHDTQPAWSLVGASACRKGDGALAEESYRHLQDASMRRYVAAICQHTRTPLPPAAGELAPKTEVAARPQVLKPRPPPAAEEPPERAITNDRIGLPPRALKSTIEIKE